MKTPPDPASDPLEARLRTLTWKPAPPAALQSSLVAALAAVSSSPPSPAPSLPHRIIQFVPAPVRWTLAACWTLSLGLRLATPTPPSSTSSPAGSAMARRPLPDGPPFFLTMQQTRQQIDALQRELERR